MKPNRKIAASVVLILVVLALVAVFTGAYFTSQSTSDNHAITAGTLNPTVTTSQPVDMTNAAPGDSADANITYYNDPFISTLPVKYRISAVEASGGDPAMFSILTCQAYLDDGTGTLVPVGASQPLSTFTILPSDITAAGISGVTSPVNPGDYHLWTFRVTFPTNADNTYQGLTSSFSFVFDSTQDSNPGWSQ